MAHWQTTPSESRFRDACIMPVSNLNMRQTFAFQKHAHYALVSSDQYIPPGETLEGGL